jgi:hypothetical protein
MPADLSLMLIAVALLVAFIVTARATMAWQSLTRQSEQVRARTVALEAAGRRAPAAFASGRRRMAETNAGVERALWSLARFDERTESAARSVASQRARFDRLRERELSRAGGAAARARTAIRIIKGLAELRRAFLG